MGSSLPCWPSPPPRPRALRITPITHCSAGADGYRYTSYWFRAPNPDREPEKLRGLKARLDIHILFDRRYYPAGGQGAPVVLERKPQPTRSWMATLEYDFDL